MTHHGETTGELAFPDEKGSDTYYLFVNEDIRWAILGPLDPEGKIRIWYGTVVEEDRLVIEEVLVGTPETDVCQFLTKQHA